MFVRRHRLRGDLPADPIGLFGENDALAVPERAERGRDAAEATTNDRDITLQLAQPSVRQQEQGAGLPEKVPAGGGGEHARHGSACSSERGFALSSAPWASSINSPGRLESGPLRCHGRPEGRRTPARIFFTLPRWETEL